MGLASLKHDTSVAYKGTTPGIATVFQSTTQEYDYTASSLQVSHLIGDSFDEQMSLAEKYEPALFTNEALISEMQYSQTLDYAKEREDRPGGLPSGAHHDILFRNIERLQKDYPDAGFQTVEALYEQAGQKVRDSRAKAESDYAQSDTLAGTLGWLGGTGYGALKDPLTALAMLFPEFKAAKGAAGFLKTTAKVGLLESSIEAGIQAGTFKFKRDAGVEPTFDQVMADVASVGLVSVLMYGGGSIVVRSLRKKIKSGEMPDTPEVREHIDNLEDAQDLVANTNAATPEELTQRLEEMRMHQSEALAGNPIDGEAASSTIKARNIEAVDLEVTRLEGDIATITNERNALAAKVDAYHSDRARFPDVEQIAASKLTRAEKKALRKEIDEAVSEGNKVQMRLQSRTDANYDLMAGSDAVSYKESVAATRARNTEIQRPIEERMTQLEARYDSAKAADAAENELRRLKVKIANDTFDPVSAALRIEELDVSTKAQDQELFALQAERGELSKPTPVPEEVVAIKEAIEADIEITTPTPNMSRGFDLPEIDSLGARKGPELHKAHTGVMPTFQGGKQKMAKATTDAIRHVWNNADRAKITEVDDYFGGGGGWGIYNALTHFPNVKKIRLYEMNPDRIDKIKYIHQNGDTLGELLSSGKPKEILDLAAKDMDAVGVTSASALSRRVKRQMDGRVDINDAERGALAAVVDYGEASYGTRIKDGTSQEQVDAVTKLLSKQFAELRKNIEIAEQRGIEIEYVNGNSYDVANPKGDHVLGIVDPPYYNTKGYPDPIVKIGTYNDTRKLLERLNLNKNSIIYTDEAWWTKKEMPKDMDKVVDGLDARGILNDIDSSMEHFVTLPIAGRTETLGLTNGTRIKQSAKSGDSRSTGVGRASTDDGRQRPSSVHQGATVRVDGNLDGAGSAIHATKLDAPSKQDLSFDEQVDVEIAEADALASKDLPILEIDEFGNEVLRPSNLVMVKANREINSVERLMECAL